MADSSPPRIDRPYQPRELTKKELLRENIHAYFSPKEQRWIRICGVANLVIGLQQEFAPFITGYVERPRMLSVGNDIYEFAFWARDRDGRETLLLLVAMCSSESISGGRRRHRQAEALLAAAEAANLPLQFVLESDLMAQGALLASHIRLLSGVQLAARLDNRAVLRDRIVEFVASQQRCHVSLVVRSLDQYSMSDVRLVVCDLIHAGLLEFARDQAWNDQSVVWRPS